MPDYSQGQLLTERQLHLIDTATRLEQEPEASEPYSYAARLWAQLSLPYKDPGQTPEWTRRNNSITLTITPGLVTRPDGTRERAYPYGVLPRYLMTWMTTEAVRTRSRHLELGASLTAFLARLGLNGSGATGRRVMDQLHRLAVAGMNIEDLRTREDRWGVAGANFNVASRYELWFSRRQTEQPDRMLGSTITLSEDFYRSVMEAPVPLRPEVLRILAGSPMRLDLYTWLVYRLRYLAKPTTVTWGQLAGQFGSDYKLQRQFKAAFTRNLREVQVIYPQARFAIMGAGLRLQPSPAHIPSRESSS
jgi:hypothetical protein